VKLLRHTGRENIDDIPLMISTVLVKRQGAQKAYRHRRDHFGLTVGLYPKTRGHKLANVSTIEISELEEAYPPSGHDIYETLAAKHIWEKYQKTTPYPDPREGRTWKPFHELDPRKLQYVVQENESIVIRDSATRELIGVVIRNFSNNNRRVLEWINGIIMENNDLRRSVRVGSFSKSCLGGLSQFFLA
jgi:hypothetical protein